MDFCILGLLLILPRSSYELRVAFAQSLGLFYSGSLGSVQITVKKLLERGLVELACEQDLGRRKKTWQPTEAGRRWFFGAMHSPVPPGKLEETILARFHFLGLIDTRTERCTILAMLVTAIEKALDELEQQQTQLPENSIPEAWRQIAHYQLATLDYGIQAHRQGLAWFQQQLELELANLD